MWDLARYVLFGDLVNEADVVSIFKRRSPTDDNSEAGH